MHAIRKTVSAALAAAALAAFSPAGTAAAAPASPESYIYRGARLTGLGGDPSRLRVADTDGDNFDDIVQFTTDGRAYVWRGGESAITYAGLWATGFGGDMSRIAFVDVEGDGDSDVLQLAPSGTVYAWRSQGTAAPTYLGAVATGTGADVERIIVQSTSTDAALYQHAPDGRLYRWFWSSGMSRFDYYGLAASGTGADSSRVKIIGNLVAQITAGGSLYGWVYAGTSVPNEYLGRIATGLGDDMSRIAVIRDRLSGGAVDSVVQLASNGSMYGWQVAADWRSTSYRGPIATGLGADVSRIRFPHVFNSQGCRIGFDDIVQLAPSGSVYGWAGSGLTGGNPTYQGLMVTGVGADPDKILIGDFGGTFHRDFLQVTGAGVGYLWESADGFNADCVS